jgi:hypothetical protein
VQDRLVCDRRLSVGLCPSEDFSRNLHAKFSFAYSSSIEECIILPAGVREDRARQEGKDRGAGAGCLHDPIPIPMVPSMTQSKAEKEAKKKNTLL